MEAGKNMSRSEDLHPMQLSDFRPISITADLSHVTERIIVRDYLYPVLISPSLTLTFADQYAFRPNGFTTAALVAFLQKVTNLLDSNPYVVVTAL